MLPWLHTEESGKREEKWKKKIKSLPQTTFTWIGYIVIREVGGPVTVKPWISFKFIPTAEISFLHKD